MTREQLVATAFLLLVAGNATVAGMINLGVVTLLEHREQLEQLMVCGLHPCSRVPGTRCDSIGGGLPSYA
jgi:hypothetical protein